MTQRWHHRRHLDGLRALAALAVLLFHAGLPAAAGGFVGVDAFFVLSGFLITSVLLREHSTTQGISLMRFWGRRARRLLPSALVVLVATVLVQSSLTAPLEAARHADDVLASAVYVSNWWFLDQAHDYFSHDQAVSPLLHMWSLAVEEQFYVLWPVLVLALTCWVPAQRRLPLLAVAAFAGLGWAMLQDPLRAHYATDARAGHLLLGAALAVCPIPRSRHGGWVAGLALLGLIGVGSGLLTCPPVPRGVLAAMLTATFIAAGEAAGPEFRMLGLSGPVAGLLGRVSYPSYLWHWPVLLWIADSKPEMPPLERAGVGFVVVTALAWVTWRLVEQRLRGPGSGGAIAVGGVASLLVGLGGRAMLGSGDKDGIVMADHFEQMEPQATIIQGAAARAGAPRLVLAGDSHAEHWWPAVRRLAERSGWAADLLWVQDCGWPVMDLAATGATREARCGPLLREALKSHVEQSSADLVILASFTTGIRVLPGEIDHPIAEDDARAHIIEASEAMIDPLVASGAEVVILEPIPVLSQHPLSCVTADLDATACATTPQVLALEHRAEAAWRALAAARSHVSTVDLDALVCPEAACPTVVGGRLTRRDTHHIATAFAASLADDVGRELDRAGHGLTAPHGAPSSER